MADQVLVETPPSDAHQVLDVTPPEEAHQEVLDVTPPSSMRRKRIAKRRPDSLADEDRCTRTGSPNWRCNLPRLAGKRMCRKHHRSNLTRAKSPKPEPQRAPDLREIWAYCRTPGEHPRSYALVSRKFPNGILVDATPLTPSAPDLACGDFTPDNSIVSMDITAFTYRVFFEYGDGLVFKIYPRKGEVWQVDFGLVEVVSNFCEETGVLTAVVLVNVDGQSGLCRRQMHMGCDLLRTFRRDELRTFSHRVTNVRIVSGDQASWEESSMNCEGAASLQFTSSIEEHAVDPTANKENKTLVGNVNTASIVTAIPLARFESTGVFWENYQNVDVCTKGSRESEQESFHSAEDNGGEANTEPIRVSDEIVRNPEQNVEAIGDINSKKANSTNEQPDIKLFGFSDTEVERIFTPGDVWALYDDFDGMPRTYARITRSMPSKGRVMVTPMEPHPTSDQELQYVDDNIPLACGTFRESKSTLVKEVVFFSHRVVCDKVEGTKLFNRILPRQGEVWAIYKNWDYSWTYSDVKNNSEYTLVEVVSDYTDEAGITVAPLVKAAGDEVILQRLSTGNSNSTIAFKREDLLRFSHRVPSLKAVERGNKN